MIKADKFKYFKKRVVFWQDILGLVSTEFSIHFKDLRESGTIACFDVCPTSGYIQVTLNKRYKRYLTNVDIDRAAFHEVFEAGYLSDLRAMAKATYSNYEVEKETHRVVMTAENTIFKKLR